MWRSNLIWLRYLGSKIFICLFVCLLICLYFILIILGYPQEYTLEILWRSNLIWLRYIGSKNVYLFFCLFIDLFVFYFNNLGTTTGSYPENFVKIGLDLAEIIRILKMFICLLICSFFKSSWDTHRKMPSKFCGDPTWFGWDI